MAELTVKRGPQILSPEQITDEVSAWFQAKMDELSANSSAQPEAAEPFGEWDIWCLGPFQNLSAGGPLSPHRILKVGESFSLPVVLWLNPAMLVGPMTACDRLSNFALPYELECVCSNLSTMTPAGLGGKRTGNLVPGQCFYIENFVVTPQVAGLYEINVTARLLGAGGGSDPHFGAFANFITDPEFDFFDDPIQFHNEMPLRFAVYP